MAGTPVRRDTDRQKSGYGPELTPARESARFWSALLPDSLQLQIQDVIPNLSCWQLTIPCRGPRCALLTDSLSFQQCHRLS